MRVRLEYDSHIKLKQLQTWALSFKELDRGTLFKLATDPSQEVKNINERATAIIVLRTLLEKASKQFDTSNLLTDDEVEQLYCLLINEDDFPILVDTESFVVQDVTYVEKGKAVPEKTIVRDIEENCALLRAEAALLIVDFGQRTKRFLELKPKIIEGVKEIVLNMLCEKDQIFFKETIVDGSTTDVNQSLYFRVFVEALYFVDKDSARLFMASFDVNESGFSYKRKVNKTN